jgi:pimeloyl-ACP methyl ester carboxylesterase
MMILIHGAYHGAWCWDGVLDRLSDAGIPAIAPDLPGHGRDSGWLTDQTMTGYAERISDLASAAAQPVTLVGHSMAGAIAAMVAENDPDRISRIIFLTAYIPENGESVADLVAMDTESHARVSRVDVEGINAICLKAGTLPDAFYNLAPGTAVRYAEDRVQLQSPTPFRRQLDLTPERYGSVAKTAIICSLDRAISAAHQRWMAERANCDPITELASDHSPFLSQPDGLSALLRRLIA